MAEDKGVYRCYIPKKFKDDTLKIIELANDIIAKYQDMGYSLTLRALHYQFVNRGFPNTQAHYNRLGSIISDARLAGMISWTAIEDQQRGLVGFNTLSGVPEALSRARDTFKLDLWADQPMRPEVWVEKQALVNTIEGICGHLRVDFFACKGYNSQSEQWVAGQRFADYVRRGQRPIVFHLGDHDPSGLDMTRDNEERLSMFAGVPIQVVRLALNYNQVEQFKLPPNFAKMTDSRASGYVDKYGEESWELDALEPPFIESLIKDAVDRIRDESIWSASLAREVQDLELLDDLIQETAGGKPDED
jgi:hypothetical protein